MGGLITFLIVILVVICVLIVASILLQEDKSGGGIGIVGGSSQSFFGASSGSILARITTILVAVFLVLSLVVGAISSRQTKLIDKSSISKLQFMGGDDIEQETSEKVLSALPEKVVVEDFDNFILNKIKTEKNKKTILAVYKKDKQNKYYNLNKKSEDLQKEKALGVLNLIGYHNEAVEVSN